MCMTGIVSGELKRVKSEHDEYFISHTTNSMWKSILRLVYRIDENSFFFFPFSYFNQFIIEKLVKPFRTVYVECVRVCWYATLDGELTFSDGRIKIEEMEQSFLNFSFLMDYTFDIRSLKLSPKQKYCKTLYTIEVRHSS